MQKLLITFYFVFSVVYTLKFRGFWYMILGLILPIFPLIDLATFLIDKYLI